MHDHPTNAPAETPSDPLAAIGHYRDLITLMADPEAFKAALEELRNSTAVSLAAKDEAAAAQAALAREREAFEAEKAAALGELAAERQRLAERELKVVRGQAALEESRRWVAEMSRRYGRLGGGMGIDLNDPYQMQALAEGRYDRQGMLEEAGLPAPEAEREPELETVAVDTDGLPYSAGVSLTRSQPRRGGRRVAQ